MFSEILFTSLWPLLQADYSQDEVRDLSEYIADSLEINPREGNNIPLLRDSILNYLNSPVVQQKHKELLHSRFQAAAKLQQLQVSLGQLSQISTQALKSSLQVSVTDGTIAREIYNLNFGYNQNLGEIIYKTKFNQGGRLGF
jgi:hypothetical protein